MSDKPLNLHQKLVEVRKSIASLSKDGQSYGYQYVTGTQVLAKIKGKLDELNVLLFPSITTQQHEVYPYTNSKGKAVQDFLVFGDMSYQWINADNPEEVLTIPWKYTGQQDDISKAFGSGLTYSERYFLLKFFGVPTDADDPDHENQSKQKQPQQQGQGQNNNSYNNNKSGPSEAQIKLLNGLIDKVSKKHNLTRDAAIDTLKKKPEIGQFKSLTELTPGKEGTASKAITILQEALK